MVSIKNELVTQQEMDLEECFAEWHGIPNSYVWVFPHLPHPEFRIAAEAYFTSNKGKALYIQFKWAEYTVILQ